MFFKKGPLVGKEEDSKIQKKAVNLLKNNFSKISGFFKKKFLKSDL